MRFKFPALLALCGVLLIGCAPHLPEDPAADTPAVRPDVTRPEPAVAAPAPDRQALRPPEVTPGEPLLPTPAGPTAEPPPLVQTPQGPNWPARLQELTAYYREQFEGPQPGDMVTLVMRSDGRTVQGVVEHLEADELGLLVDIGRVTIYPEQVNDATRLRIFRDAYADHFARQRARGEFLAWQQEQQGSTVAVSPPAADPQVAVRPPVSEPPLSIDPPPPRVTRDVEPPRNLPPDGRVPSVERYIRRNAAVPDSLRILQWGPVLPHQDGYQVRVRYSLQGADGFGNTLEDMIFFMHADGSVFRRAVHRGPSR